jgi:hypothetical protein
MKLFLYFFLFFTMFFPGLSDKHENGGTAAAWECFVPYFFSIVLIFAELPGPSVGKIFPPLKC